MLELGQKLKVVQIYAHVDTLMHPYRHGRHSLETTIIVSLLTLVDGLGAAYSFQTISYGMGSSVKMKVIAAPLSLHHAWFVTELIKPSSDDIEVRICGSESTDNEDTPIEVMEIYVH